MSVLAIYHDMAIIRRVASRVLVLENGEITADGTPDEVLSGDFRGLAEVYA